VGREDIGKLSLLPATGAWHTRFVMRLEMLSRLVLLVLCIQEIKYDVRLLQRVPVSVNLT
jgi:hypothetical protein